MVKYLGPLLIGGGTALKVVEHNTDYSLDRITISGKENAAEYLRTARSRSGRGNTGWFEEALDDPDLYRECMLDRCDNDEMKEIYKNSDNQNADMENAWANIKKMCTVTPCDPRGATECHQYWSYRKCVCKTDINGKPMFEGDPAYADYKRLVNGQIVDDPFAKGRQAEDTGNCGKKIDYCTMNPDICKTSCGHSEANKDVCNDVPEGVCRNKLFDVAPGKQLAYTCECQTGFMIQYDDNNEYFTCEDIDECADSSLCPAEFCVNTKGGFECNCPAGQSVINGDCVEQNECLNTHICDDKINSVCVDRDGGYDCVCPDGFTEELGAERTLYCADIDECATEVGLCDGDYTECINTDGGYECAILKEFNGKCYLDENQEVQDINECETANPCNSDLKEVCHNFQCGYACCTYGQKFDEKSNTCVDACQNVDCGDERVCQFDIETGVPTCVCEEEDYHYIDDYGCQNTDDFYDMYPDGSLDDFAGYWLKQQDPCANHVCADDEVCQVNSSRDPVCCKDYQVLEKDVCVDDFMTCGKFICSNPAEESLTEEWEIQCDIQKFKCPNTLQCGEFECKFGQYCLEWEGRFMCKDNIPESPEADICDPGFKLRLSDGECYDIDECQIDNGGCPERCMNFYGTFYCYSEPEEHRKFCHHYSIAKPENTDFGGYGCDCFESYGLCDDGFTCTTEVWDSSIRSVTDLLSKDNAANPTDCSYDESQIAFGGKCYQMQNVRKDYYFAAEKFCADNGGKLASVNSRQLWWILGNSLDTEKPYGYETYFVNADSDAEAAELVVHGEESKDISALVSNIAADMRMVPPSLNWVSGLKEHYYFCEYAPGGGHPVEARAPEEAAPEEDAPVDVEESNNSEPETPEAAQPESSESEGQPEPENSSESEAEDQQPVPEATPAPEIPENDAFANEIDNFFNTNNDDAEDTDGLDDIDDDYYDGEDDYGDDGYEGDDGYGDGDYIDDDYNYPDEGSDGLPKRK